MHKLNLTLSDTELSNIFNALKAYEMEFVNLAEDNPALETFATGMAIDQTLLRDKIKTNIQENK